MLGSLTGTVTAQLTNRLLLQVGGVGYWVFTGTWHPQEEVTCFLYHHIREDMSDLYGFESITVLQLFEKLIGISGIGPKAALALLSIGTPNRIQEAIQNKDTTFLSSAPGIGAKAAQKIVLELHNKIDSLGDLLGDNGSSDLLDALAGLGYKTNDIRPLISKMPPELTSIDAQVKWALQNL